MFFYYKHNFNYNDFLCSLTIGSSSENNSVADLQSEREDSPDLIANLIHDTTQKLQNLTHELNNEDENIMKMENKTTENSNALNENYEQTLKNLLQHQQPLSNNAKTNCTADVQKSEPSSASSSLAMHQQTNLHPNDDLTTQTKSCELNALNTTTLASNNSLMDCATTSNIPLATTTTNTSSNNVSTNSIDAANTNTTTTNTNGVPQDINTNGQAMHDAKELSESDDKYVEKLNGGITLHKTGHMSLDLMQSVDLSSGKIF